MKRGEQTSCNSKMYWRCGSSTRNPDNCWFKTKFYHKCKSVRHIQKWCNAVAKWRAANLTKESIKSLVHSVREQTTDYSQAYAINHVDVTPPSDATDKTDCVRAAISATSDASDGTSQFTVAVSIEGKRVVFEIDAAASVSVFGKHMYRSQLSEFQLSLCLESYSGGGGGSLAYWVRFKCLLCILVKV